MARQARLTFTSNHTGLHHLAGLDEIFIRCIWLYNLLINAMSSKRRGRPPNYLNADGTPATPPSYEPYNGKWLKSLSADTTPGSILVSLLHRGEVQFDEEPKSIWNRFPQLRVINPHGSNWRKFIDNCKKEAAETPPPLSEDSTTMSNTYNEDASASGSRDPATIMHHLGRSIGADPLEGNQPAAPRALARLDEVSVRNVPVQMPTRQFQSRDGQSTFIMVNMSKGMQAQLLKIIRFKDQLNQLLLTHDSLFQNEHAVEELLCGGTEGVLEEDDPIIEALWRAVQLLEDLLPEDHPEILSIKSTIDRLIDGSGARLSRTDDTVLAFKSSMVQANGEVAANDRQPTPQYEQVLTLPMDVEPVVSEWDATLDDGTTEKMPGMFETPCKKFVFMHFKKIDSSKGAINSISPLPTRKNKKAKGTMTSVSRGGGGGGGGGGGRDTRGSSGLRGGSSRGGYTR